MNALAEQCNKSRATLDAVIARVCGACARNCCHQGTMMGTQDVRRLVKGVRIEPGRAGTVRAGLRARAAELRADLAVLRRVIDLIGTANLSGGDLGQLQRQADQWEAFCDLLESDSPLTFENLIRLQMFSAVRSNALRALAPFPGGLSALVNFGRDVSSFRFVHRRIAPPRCLYHVASADGGTTGGCVAGRWKPAKCANFFCPADPNVLREIGQAMSFDDFVLANALPASTAEVLVAVAVELEFGADYIEPKVFIGYGPEFAARLGQSLRNARMAVNAEQVSGHYLQSTAEVCADLERLPSDTARVIDCGTVDGASLYELAVALDRFRAAGRPQPFYLVAAELRPRSFIPHPLWADEMMAQPLGSLDIYLCDDE